MQTANCLRLPGLLDSHIHGQAGYDFSDIDIFPEVLPKILKALVNQGVSYVMPTFISLPLAKLKKCLQVLNDYVAAQSSIVSEDAAIIVGVHLEGPFIDKACSGAHNPLALQAHLDIALFKQIIASAPKIRQWKITISPALSGALTFMEGIDELKNENIFIKVFLGHSAAAYDVIEQAIQLGAAGFTHLGNACQEKAARKEHTLSKHEVTSPLVQWVLNNKERCPSGIELILDGVHLSHPFIKLIHAHLADKIILITDALGPTGLGNGAYQLGDVPIYKRDDQFYLMKDNHETEQLAGSAMTLPRCIKNYFSLFCPNIDELYQILIRNTRDSSLSCEQDLFFNDDENYVLLHPETGKLLLSAHRGKIKYPRES